ncbi:HAD-IIB family hydrolase [Methylicorpusculum oleiharenae]|uniref:HAD-IIB family hydrolase n=1 Tax=Methylicorpusculum oleiharenae TaxID=1338687 RepID=UPI001356EEBD|nr:HAD-IIB family hydrolase [Methylicorpusculum oleiharenae]MCD2452691.1 HAD-IIB family hydrolase [Methylicorpusculum oleiharenae]
MSKHILICTDLDRTLLPNGKQPESPGARAAFARLVSRLEVSLAFVSGRHRQLVEEAISQYQIPIPDWVIGDVGTTIYQLKDNKWLPWPEWEQEISLDWQGLTAHDLRPFFREFKALTLQEESKQNRYKLSYYLPLETKVRPLQHAMLLRLSLANIRASLIYSVDEETSTGLLDVLPERATKLHAVEFLMRNKDFDISNTVFAGDSGNDLPVLTSAIQSVLVANAGLDVVEQAQYQSLQEGSESALYLAQGGFMGMNGNYSAGILEGVAHYHPETRHWMEQDDEQ